MKTWNDGFNGCYCTHDQTSKPAAGTTFTTTIDDHCFHIEQNAQPADFDPMEHLIHEHECLGQNINFQQCNSNSHRITGDFQRPIGTPIDFCVVFFGEESFKNDVDKRGLVLM